MGARDRARGARLAHLLPPPGRLWLAAGSACVTATVLGVATVSVALVTVLGDSCGEDWRWVALAGATALATVAAVVGLGVGGSSLHPRRARGDAGDGRWTTTVVVLTAVAWGVAAVAPALPSGACS